MFITIFGNCNQSKTLILLIPEWAHLVRTSTFGILMELCSLQVCKSLYKTIFGYPYITKEGLQ